MNRLSDDGIFRMAYYCKSRAAGKLFEQVLAAVRVALSEKKTEIKISVHLCDELLASRKAILVMRGCLNAIAMEVPQNINETAIEIEMTKAAKRTLSQADKILRGEDE